MAFCKLCGKEISEGNICEDCQTVNAEKSAIIPNLSGDKKNLIIFVGAVAVIFILLIAIISSLFGGSYKTPINDMIKGINKADSKLIFEAMYPEDYIKETIKDEDMSAKEFYKELDGILEYSLDYLEEEYGKNIKISFDFDDKTKLTDKDIKSFEEYYDYYFDIKVDITKAYEIDGVLEIKGKDDDVEDDAEFVVVKIKGEGWKVFPGDGDTSFFDIF